MSNVPMKDCPKCNGEGKLFETKARFSTAMEQWYPEERVTGYCDVCDGTGEVPVEEDREGLPAGHVGRYTDASERYDYGYTTYYGDTGWFNKSGQKQQFRYVVIPEERLDYQAGRYGSGLHVCLTEHEFEQWKKDGFIWEDPDFWNDNPNTFNEAAQ